MPKHIPQSITNHLTAYQLETLAPAWIELEATTDIAKTTGGAWQHYFEVQPTLNKPMTQSCTLLEGMLPIQEAFELPHMQLSNGKYTDILAFRDTSSDWLLFLDVTDKVLQLQKYQQIANELNLVKSQLQRTLGRYVGDEVASRASKGELTFNQDGERRDITTLFVDIRGFTPFNEAHDAQEVINTLNQYMNGMLTPILSHSGMIDKIMGDGAMAVFGVLESESSSIDDAFSAALEIQSNIKIVNIQRRKENLAVLGVGVGIATGSAVLGILGSHERRAFTAIGKHVNLAARLESDARAGEILIDKATLSGLSKKPTYHQINMELKGIGKSEVYAIMPSH